MNVFTYPLGYKTNHFRQSRRLLLATSQAAGVLWEFRWGTTAGHICFVNRTRVNALQIANATAEELRFSLKVARTFTVADTTNVTSILRAGDMQKLHGASADSVLSNFLESSSATAPTGGTMTLDTDPIANGSYYSLGTVTTTFDGADDEVLDFNPGLESLQPLRLEKNEGFVVNLDVIKGATQGVVVNLEVAWTECIKIP